MFHETIQVLDVLILLLAAIVLGASGWNWKMRHTNHATTLKVVKPSVLKHVNFTATNKKPHSA